MALKSSNGNNEDEDLYIDDRDNDLTGFLKEAKKIIRKQKQSD